MVSEPSQAARYQLTAMHLPSTSQATHSLRPPFWLHGLSVLYGGIVTAQVLYYNAPVVVVLVSVTNTARQQTLGDTTKRKGQTMTISRMFAAVRAQISSKTRDLSSELDDIVGKHPLKSFALPAGVQKC